MEDVEEEVFSTNHFGHVPVEVGVIPLKSDKNSLQNKGGLKVFAVFICQHVDSQTDQTSSVNSDNMEADLYNHKIAIFRLSGKSTMSIRRSNMLPLICHQTKTNL